MPRTHPYPKHLRRPASLPEAVECRAYAGRQLGSRTTHDPTTGHSRSERPEFGELREMREFQAQGLFGWDPGLHLIPMSSLCRDRPWMQEQANAKPQSSQDRALVDH